MTARTRWRKPERRLRAEADPPPSPAMDAVDAHRARFGGTPWPVHIPGDRMPAWRGAIREDSRTGKRLGEVDMQRVAGFGCPPPGTPS